MFEKGVRDWGDFINGVGMEESYFNYKVQLEALFKNTLS